MSDMPESSTLVLYRPPSRVTIGVFAIIGSLLLCMVIGFTSLSVYIGGVIGGAAGYVAFLISKQRALDRFVSEIADGFLSSHPELTHSPSQVESRRKSIKGTIIKLLSHARQQSWRNSSTKGFSMTELSLAINDQLKELGDGMDATLLLRLQEYLDVRVRIMNDDEEDELNDPRTISWAWYLWPF